MGSPGWKATVKRSGTSTQFTGEATSKILGSAYQVTDSEKRELAEPVAVMDGGTPVDVGDIAAIDYSQGIVTLAAGYVVAGGVMINGEATTEIKGSTHQVTASAKRVLDRSKTVVVKDDGNVVDEADILSIDYLFAKSTFVPGYSVAGAVTFDAHYLPLLPVAGANSYTLNLPTEMLDDTDFDHAQSTGHRRRKYGLDDASVSIKRWDDITGHFKDVIKNREIVVIEVKPGAGADMFRAYMLCETANSSGDVGALESEELSFQLDGDRPGMAFSWGR